MNIVTQCEDWNLQDVIKTAEIEKTALTKGSKKDAMTKYGVDESDLIMKEEDEDE